MAEAGQVEVEIECELTETERQARACDGCRLNDELDKMVEAFKDDRALWRTKIKSLKNLRDDTNKAFMIGSERRKMMCVANVDMDKKIMEFIHEGRVVKTRDLTSEEIIANAERPMFDTPSAQEDIGHVIKAETKRNSKKDLMV